MALREFSTTKYLPLLSVRPAEMRALEELPGQDKDLLFPYMALRPWTTAYHLDSAVSRIEEAYGNRPLIMDLDEDAIPKGARRPVHDELDELRSPANGYANWAGFIESRQNLVPVVQLAEPSQIQKQMERLASLGRGVVLRVPTAAFGQVVNLVNIAKQYLDETDLCVVLDFERESRELLTRMAVTAGMIGSIRSVVEGCFVATSASSFPENFTGRAAQDIYERQFFNGVVGAVGTGRLIYSDRGSARAGRQTGGGGAPAPRVDNAIATRWKFFREEDDGDRAAAYQEAAIRAIDDSDWNTEIRVWGTQMVERTAVGEPNAISSPLSSTAARINMHLHQQTHFDDENGLLQTDEDWSD